MPYPNNAKRHARATSINFKVIGLTRPGLVNLRAGFGPATFGFPDLPEQEADAFTHSATLTGLIVKNRKALCVYLTPHPETPPSFTPTCTLTTTPPPHSTLSTIITPLSANHTFLLEDSCLNLGRRLQKEVCGFCSTHLLKCVALGEWNIQFDCWGCIS